MKVTFKYIVIAIIALILLLPPVYAEITLRNLNIDIFVYQDGSATVREEYILNIYSNASMDKYSLNLQYLQKNDLQTWINNLGFDELRYHIGSRDAPISDLIITPSELYGINYYSEEGLAKIVLDYKVLPPSTIDNETRGLFIMSKPKPRTIRYILNKDSLNFDMTDKGDVLPPKNTKINIHLDKNMRLIYAQPFPSNINVSRFSDISSKDFTWSTGLLPKFSLVIEYEEPLEVEIINYINEKNESINKVFSGKDGVAVTIIIIIFIISIIFWYHVCNKK
ncbi:hypothetical protein J7J26_03460 [Candidatus Micrarchaeota archaeon]|nr:hypothetical protein [Candidatus Micrarchaeota archaeon]